MDIQDKTKEELQKELMELQSEFYYLNSIKDIDTAKRKQLEQEIAVALQEIAYQNEEKEKRAAELIIANLELKFQSEEKAKRAAELVIANIELVFQNKEKAKRAAELIVANKELDFQNEEKGKRAAELIIALANAADFENKFRQIAENIDEVFWLRTDTEMIYVSPSFEKIWGVPCQAIYEDPKIFTDIIHPEDKPIVQEIFHSNEFKEKGFFEYKYRIIRADNQVRWINAKTVPIVDDSGQVIKRVGIASDITEKHIDIQELIQAKEKVEESERKFRSYVENAPDGIFVVDSSGRYLEVNSSAIRILGYSEREMLNFSITDMLADESLEEGFVHFKNLIETGHANSDLLLKHKDGTKRWMTINAVKLSETNSIGFVKDITERKEAEERILKLSTAIEQSPVTVVITDTNGIIEYVNPKFTELTQYTFEEVVGKSPAILKTDNTSPEEYKIMWDTINSGAEWNGTFLNKSKNGQQFWESAKISPLRNTEGKITHFVAIKEDITQRIEVERELKEYRQNLETIVNQRTQEIDRINKDLISEIEMKKQTEILLHQSLAKEKELNQLKSRFISTASHEFRTPLTSILSSAELIQRYGKKWDEEKYQEHLNRITNSVEYLTELMDDVLTVSRIESGKIQLNPSKIDLLEICNKVIADTHLKNDNFHQLVFNYDINEKEFYLDQKQIQIILQNLLSNAIKYSPDGGKIEISIELIKQELQICISDEGLGIPDEDIPHLFEPFHRSLNTENIQGTGLGLSIVKNAVELHGGRIDVSSKLGKGTKFFITIPLSNE